MLLLPRHLPEALLGVLVIQQVINVNVCLLAYISIFLVHNINFIRVSHAYIYILMSIYIDMAAEMPVEAIWDLHRRPGIVIHSKLDRHGRIGKF